jgi:hypothetical protein
MRRGQRDGSLDRILGFLDPTSNNIIFHVDHCRIRARTQTILIEVSCLSSVPSQNAGIVPTLGHDVTN